MKNRKKPGIKKRFSHFYPIQQLREKKRFFRKGIRFLPFLFTFGNAFFGFCSVVLAFKGEFVAAAYCIFLAAMMDALDGRVARLMQVESELGIEMDSLCDAISFCLAPAFLVYAWTLRSLGLLGVFLSSLFLLAGLLRLARFNLLHMQQTIFFIGLPTTIAGCFIASVLLSANTLFYKPWFGPLIACLLIFLAWLMISSLRFVAFKRGTIRIKKHYKVALGMILFAVLAVMRLQSALLLLFVSYFLFSFAFFKQKRFVKNKKTFKRSFFCL